MLLLSGCCVGEYCDIESALEQSAPEARFANFQTLSAEDQVGLYLWQLDRSHPAHSEYGEFIVRNQRVTSTVLLKSIADEKNPVIVRIGLTAIEEMNEDVVKLLNTEQLRSSLGRCRHAYDTEDTAEPFCNFPKIELALKQ